MKVNKVVLGVLVGLFLFPDRMANAESGIDDHAHYRLDPRKPSQNIRYSDVPSTRRAAYGSAPRTHSITLITPGRWSALGEMLAGVASDTHKRFSKLFGQPAIPYTNTTIELMPEKQFYDRTGVPSWSNAIFYKGSIMIPISAEIAEGELVLKRSVSHEYVHSLTSVMTGGKCPGWIDEGLAQWSEGFVHPSFPRIFRKRLSKGRVIPLKKLRQGFTELPKSDVAMAYAQSLYFTRFLISRYGFESLGTFFRYLKAGNSYSYAYSMAFGLTETALLDFMVAHFNRTPE